LSYLDSLPHISRSQAGADNGCDFKVRRILKEAMQVEPDWNRLSLNEAGDYVESEMHKRHPELSPKALEAIGNYYTYLMR